MMPASLLPGMCGEMTIRIIQSQGEQLHDARGLVDVLLSNKQLRKGVWQRCSNHCLRQELRGSTPAFVVGELNVEGDI